MTIPETMTMVELRDFAVKNGVFYYHVYKTQGTVLIYGDRYHNVKLGKTNVTDYRPIKNFKTMKSGSKYRVLQIVRKRIKNRGWGYCLSIIKPEEIEAIKNWLEGEK